MPAKDQSDEMHAALAGNGLSHEVANFLVALAQRISVLEDKMAQLEPVG